MPYNTCYHSKRDQKGLRIWCVLFLVWKGLFNYLTKSIKWLAWSQDENIEVTNGKRECLMLIKYSFLQFVLLHVHSFKFDEPCLTNESLIRQKMFNITYRIYNKFDFSLILNEKRQMFQHRNRRGDKTLDKTILGIIVHFVLLG